jgi:hypothetical protein
MGANKTSRNEKAGTQTVALENGSGCCRVPFISIVEGNCQGRSQIDSLLQPIKQLRQWNNVEKFGEEAEIPLEFRAGTRDRVVGVVIVHAMKYYNDAAAPEKKTVQSRPENQPA